MSRFYGVLARQNFCDKGGQLDRVRHVSSSSHRYLFNVQLLRCLEFESHETRKIFTVLGNKCESASWCDGKLLEASIALTSVSPHPRLGAKLHLTLDVLNQPRFLQHAEKSFSTHTYTTYLFSSYS
jgi:hypothetical protein